MNRLHVDDIILVSLLVGAISARIVAIGHHQMQMSRRDHQGTIKFLHLDKTLMQTTTSYTASLKNCPANRLLKSAI